MPGLTCTCTHNPWVFPDKMSPIMCKMNKKWPRYAKIDVLAISCPFLICFEHSRAHFKGGGYRNLYLYPSIPTFLTHAGFKTPVIHYWWLCFLQISCFNHPRYPFFFLHSVQHLWCCKTVGLAMERFQNQTFHTPVQALRFHLGFGHKIPEPKKLHCLSKLQPRTTGQKFSKKRGWIHLRHSHTLFPHCSWWSLLFTIHFPFCNILQLYFITSHSENTQPEHSHGY